MSSSAIDPRTGTCIEFAALPNGDTAIRKSGHAAERPVLVFGRSELVAMFIGVKRGDFNHLVA
ncbi:DUF397 domain-containing protein [Streptomyces sp. NPDC051362]|uniref:DUF397 domain-containing protein n=1 Tax=Streptomyces sp. NPDC051362 TaxID=3365651 RepID=UPI003791BBD4